MANTLGVYDPLFYANEALRILKKVLGVSSRVYRGYEKSPQEPGSVINIPTPQEFTATDAPATATDLAPSVIQLTLDSWKEVKFKMTDKDLSLSKPQIITDHIEPAVYALVDKIDTDLITKMYQSTGYEHGLSAALAVADILAVRKLAGDNKMPSGNRHFMLDTTLGSEALALSAFTQWQGAGSDGQMAQRTGNLGMRFGFDFFESQNVQTHTAGAITDGTGAKVSTAYAVGVTSIVVNDATSLTGTVKAGDFFTIAGDTTKYAITANATASGNAVTLAISPSLQVAVSGAEAVTFTQTSGNMSLAWHRNAVALAMAPLSTMGRELGAQVETVSDPDTGISVRARRYYIGDSSVVGFAFDVLYGIRVLRPTNVIRLRD